MYFKGSRTEQNSTELKNFPVRRQYLEGTEDTTRGGEVPPGTPHQLSWAGESSDCLIHIGPKLYLYGIIVSHQPLVPKLALFSPNW